MKCYVFTLERDYTLRESVLIECRLRACAGIASALLQGRVLRLGVSAADCSAAQAAALAAPVLPQLCARVLPSAPLERIRASGSQALRGVRSLARGAEESASSLMQSARDLGRTALESPQEQMRAHKRAALFSLGVFAFFAVLKRVNPALYASTSLLRSVGVLCMASGLLREGIVGAVREKRPNADTLTVTAVLASAVSGRAEDSLTLLALSNFSEMLTAMAAQRARRNIKSLVALNVKELWVVDDNGVEVQIPLEQARPGMLAAIHSGELIPIDGEITQGQAAVDQSAITGEPVPRALGPGDKVYAGTNIRLGEIMVRITKVGEDTSLARIVHLVEQAQSRRAPIQNYADKMAQALVPVSFISALIVYLITRDPQRVLNMLFIDFSCGLKLSTATAISAAISRAARQGILVKGGSFIESAAGVDTIILDKTGTITEGRPQVQQLICRSGISQDLLLQLAAAAEKHSAHPLAAAILDEVNKRGLQVPEHVQSRTVIARGLEADIAPFAGFAGGSVLIGSQTFMQERNCRCELQLHKQSPQSAVVYLSLDGEVIGALEILDPIRPDFKRAVNRLRRLGIEEIVMLTGDSEQAAQFTAAAVGLDGFVAEVLPEDKAGYVMKKQSTSSVLMAGDGINDAPALAYADIGVAMGSGCTDTAMESADVTINSDDPLKLPQFIALGRRTMELVHQNFAVTIAVNTAAMMLGALGYISPLAATVVHNASTLGVVLNSGRVLFDKNIK